MRSENWDSALLVALLHGFISAVCAPAFPETWSSLPEPEAGRSLVEGVIQAVVLPSQWINSVFSADAVKWINLRLLLCTLLSKYPSEIFAELVI